MILIIAIGVFLLACIGGYVAIQKGRNRGEGFLLALLLGPFGILIEALLPSAIREE